MLSLAGGGGGTGPRDGGGGGTEPDGTRFPLNAGGTPNLWPVFSSSKGVFGGRGGGGGAPVD